jgi:AbrB family looped-hinge helix DNA binding protein
MATRVKVSSKYQIAVPSSVRKQFGIERGDHLIVEARDGYVALIPEPPSYAQRLRGLHSEIWEGIDPQEYINQERDSWDE